MGCAKADERQPSHNRSDSAITDVGVVCFIPLYVCSFLLFACKDKYFKRNHEGKMFAKINKNLKSCKFKGIN
jgi:hypothetical protein